MASILKSNNANLDKARQIKYWTRCINTPLPHQYTGMDSNRMYLAFLMISALDLLGCWDTVCTRDEKREYVNWIYRCHHPDGGFRMWPGTDFGERANSSNAKWDPANVPATYFALASLLILGDDFKRVKRKKTLLWLQRIQRQDGSFGETLVNGCIEGGRDPRLSYCATGVRHILRGWKNGTLTIDDEELQDIDVNTLVLCMSKTESYDGGMADESFHEPHAGYTFCSLATLSFIKRLQNGVGRSKESTLAPSNPQEVIRWLAYRQTELSDPDVMLNTDLLGTSNTFGDYQVKREENDIGSALYQNPEQSIVSPALQLECGCAGMNGRTNKVADTCYAWWAGASLHLLGQPELYDRKAARQYLLEKTQHPVLGGFGKFPGDLPDLHHSYLGLAALSLTGDPDIKELNAAMCISNEASSRLEALWEMWSV